MATKNMELNNQDGKSFSVLWFDSETTRILHYADFRLKFHSFVDLIETFDDVDLCVNHIEKIEDQLHHLVIIDEKSVDELLPRIHSYEQLISIYIAQPQRSETAEDWLEKYSKVKKVFHSLDDLSRELLLDRARAHHIGEPLTFTLFNIRAHEERSSLNINGNFLHFRLLIDLLLRLKTNFNDRLKFLDLCCEEYKNRNQHLKTINDFRDQYRNDEAISWYTKETFLCYHLNRSLRFEDIHWLFHFRFFIQDLYRSLRHWQCQQHSKGTITVYRNQIISPDELFQLTNSIGGLISFISFFSTSTDREKRQFLFGDDPQLFTNVKAVLFEIDVDFSMNDDNHIFADITHLSHFAEGENEILFMSGTVFRLEKIYKESFINIVKLRLCSKSEIGEFEQLLEPMKIEFGIGSDETLLTLGSLLYQAGRYEKAKVFYSEILDQLKSDDHLIPNCYQGLGFVAAAQNDLENAFKWQNQVLQYYEQHKELSNDFCIAITWNTIGNLHFRNKDYPSALVAYGKAKELFGQRHDKQLASCLNNIGNVYQEIGQINEALETHKRALDIRESILPPNHYELGISHHNLANVYRDLKKTDQAQMHIKRALNIFKKSLKSNDSKLVSVYQTMGALQIDCGAYRQGLQYLQQAVVLCNESLPRNHPMNTQLNTMIFNTMLTMQSMGFQCN